MFRFLGFVWDDRDPTARAGARQLIERLYPNPEWQVCLEKRGLHVACAGIRAGSTQPYMLASDSGVVFGTLFTREVDGSPSRRVPLTLEAGESAEIVRSGGRRLINSYWGRYVAFLRKDDSGDVPSTTWILRDPSGGIPCLTMKLGGVSLYFSSMDVVGHLGLGPYEVDWGFLTAAICMLRHHSRSTALRDVAKLVTGECYEHRGDQVQRHLYWSPLEIAVTAPIENPEEAARELRRCVRDAVHAWASCYDSMLLSLSGGLDSTIVFACLRDAPTRPRITCFHYYPLGTDLDERQFARSVAQDSGIELVERPRDSKLDLSQLLNVWPDHEPTNHFYYVEHTERDRKLATEYSAPVVVTGWGGDQLFYQEQAHRGAGDYLRRHGLNPGVFGVALQAAHIDRMSVWSVLREGFTQHFLGRRWDFAGEIAHYRPLLRPEIAAEVSAGSKAYLNPLLAETDHAPNGKLWHARQLNIPWDFYDPLGRPDDAERISPLYSQPIIELCLRIPLYVLTAGGWDRAIARRAFYHDIPRGILNRKNKGGIEAHIRGIVDQNRPFVRNLLLDGMLAQRGVFDRQKLATFLSGKANRIQSNHGELLDYIGAEVWLRSWGHKALRAAA